MGYLNTYWSIDHESDEGMEWASEQVSQSISEWALRQAGKYLKSSLVDEWGDPKTDEIE